MRFAAIDALRGFAALWVAWYHFHGAAKYPFSAPMIEQGHLGVYVFFVLSGFVIAKNLSGRVTGRTIGLFALRRSVRLDPTYWTVIGISLAAEAYAGRRYSPTAILANMFYVNKLTNFSSIVNVGWTLCLEVQFYLVYAVLAWLCSTSTPTAQNVRRAVVFSALLFVSLWFEFPDSLFLPYWYAFFAGVVVWWTVAGEVPAVASILVLAIIAAARPSPEGVTAAATGGVILALGLTGRLNAFDYAVPQFFGRISYSLYLIHPLVARFVRRYDGSAWISLPLGAAVAVAAAYALYRCVERPTHQWARRIGRPPTAEGLAA
jgi:peptidoglycan/LPS O-acetylase OafA/YrhL